ncbi:MAG: FAD-dependent oxidoreductase, partial [Candidatus Tectomicrobia bacterium]
MQRQTAVLILGGGIIGCSIAFHLAKKGQRDVVLLEKNAIASGTTPLAAGL